jgi:NADPH2:quinone reductase
MKALVCTKIGGEEYLEVRDDWPVGECGPNQVRISVRAASVNFPDVLVIRDLYQMKLEPPFVPGNECSGVVTEVGADVEGTEVGDRVLALLGSGAFAQEVVATRPWMQVHRIPDGMPWEEAAAFNLAYGTAALGLARGEVQPGETVLVLGAAGGCGSAAVQVAKAMGATVIAVAGGADKTAFCAGLGADHVVDHQRIESLSSVVKALTGGRGVDALFDPVGGADGRENLRCLAWNGRYLVVGFAGGEIPSVALNQTILKSVSLVGVAYGASAIVDPAGNRALFDQLFAWYREGLVHPVISQRYSLDDAADAIRLMGGRGAIGKVVIEIA